MRRTSLVLAAAGGAAVLAVTGVALGLSTADRSAPRTALTAATASPATDDNPAPDDDPTSTGAAPSGTADGAVSGKRAGEIALARVGGGRIVEVEAELEHGRRVWSVKVARDGTTYEVKVDRGDGTVVEVERKLADGRGRDRTGGDDRGGTRPGGDDRSHDVGDDHGGDRLRTDDRNHDVGDDHGGDRPRDRDDD